VRDVLIPQIETARKKTEETKKYRVTTSPLSGKQIALMAVHSGSIFRLQRAPDTK
jgi:hypothetical protein